MEVTDTATEDSISVGERSPDSMDEDQGDGMSNDLSESKNRSKRKPSKTQIKHIAPKDELGETAGGAALPKFASPVDNDCDTSKYGTHSMDDLFRDVTQGIYHVSEVQPHQEPILTQIAASGQVAQAGEVIPHTRRPRRSSQASVMSTGSGKSRPAPCYPCGICGKIFRVPSRYDSHMLGHSKGKPYCCNTCGKMFSSQLKLDQHLPVHNCDRAAAFTCEICGKVCVNWRAYLYHLKAKHSETGGKRFACNLCGRQFHTGLRLRNHLASHEVGKNHCCHTCGKLFESKKKLDTHMLVHSLPSKHGQNLRCSDCGKEYTDWIPFKQHMKTHGAEGVQYPCGICDMIFPTQYEKEKHKRVHKQLQCEFCDRYFRSASVLSVHLRVHTGERPYKCGLCDRDFSQSAVLKVHMRTHRKDGRYECKRCGNVYLEVMEFYRHHLAHLEEGNLQCEECGKMFDNINSKNRHMAAHRDRAGRACQVCGKEFGRMSHLEAHMLCHTDQLPLLCKVCGKMFPSQEVLSTHYATHLDEDGVSSSGLPASKGPLFCGLCGKMFKGQIYLNNHMKRHEQEGLNSRGGDEIQDEEVVEVEGGEFACIDCGKAFGKKHHLSVHRREHTGERPHTCILCGQSFMYRKKLLEHIAEHKRTGLMYSGPTGKKSGGLSKKKVLTKGEPVYTGKEGESGSETETDNENHEEGVSGTPVSGYTGVDKALGNSQQNVQPIRDVSFTKTENNIYTDKLPSSKPDHSVQGKSLIENSRPLTVDPKLLSPDATNSKMFNDRSLTFEERQYILNQERQFISGHSRQLLPGQERQFTPGQDRQFSPNQERQFRDNQERQYNENDDRQFAERQYRKKNYIENPTMPEYGEKLFVGNGESSSDKRFVDGPSDVFSRKFVSGHENKYEESASSLMRKEQAQLMMNEHPTLQYRSSYNSQSLASASHLLNSSSHLQSPLSTDTYLRPELPASIEEQMQARMLPNVKDTTAQHSVHMIRPQPQFASSAHIDYRDDMLSTSFSCGKAYLPSSLGNLPSRSSYPASFHSSHGRFTTDSQLAVTNFQLLPQTAFPENSHQS